jgi:hypothetical protein
LDYELRLFGFATAYRDFPDAAVLRLQVRIGSMIAGDCGTSTIPQAEGRTPMASGILGKPNHPLALMTRAKCFALHVETQVN